VQKYAYFGTHCTNLNEDRPTHAATRMYANDSSFWKNKVYADTAVLKVLAGASNESGVVDDGNFWRFE